MARLSFFDHTAVIIQILLSPLYLFLIASLVSGATIISSLFNIIWSATNWQPEDQFLRTLYSPFWAVFKYLAFMLAVVFYVPPFPVMFAVGLVLEVFLFVPQLVYFIYLWYKWTFNYHKLVGNKKTGVQASGLLKED